MRSGPTEDLHDFFILLVAIKTKTVTRVTGGIICTCPLKPLSILKKQAGLKSYLFSHELSC
jgi:hypothetical protein